MPIEEYENVKIKTAGFLVLLSAGSEHYFEVKKGLDSISESENGYLKQSCWLTEKLAHLSVWL